LYIYSGQRYVWVGLVFNIVYDGGVTGCGGGGGGGVDIIVVNHFFVVLSTISRSERRPTVLMGSYCNCSEEVCVSL
jgi:hypothetical protein